MDNVTKWAVSEPVWVRGRIHKGRGLGWVSIPWLNPYPQGGLAGFPWVFLMGVFLMEVLYYKYAASLLDWSAVQYGFYVKGNTHPKYFISRHLSKKNPSIQHHITMSFSIEELSTIPMYCKCTVSECVMNNGDPLVENKKAHEAAKLTSASSAEAPSKNTSKACIL